MNDEEKKNTGEGSLHFVLRDSDFQNLPKLTNLKLNLNGHKKKNSKNLYKKQLNIFRRMLS